MVLHNLIALSATEECYDIAFFFQSFSFKIVKALALAFRDPHCGNDSQ